ncbi:Ferrous-iron efflux pump FieF [uncultured Clostridium sp.]|uniref:cation diffusion facilitator family transporter n=1 Tax=uncultured Clostridium sp. TaxID=59620 RepID=UPI000820FEA3|nr:cation diffusion facilitator family transporter [uncultured Clostridium sp.]SCI82517.1 Ferrous-iron efflux pump FieF [uncultured Clostridium sp.]
MEEEKENKYHMIKRVLIIILIANFAVSAAKIIIGYLTKSLSLSADGFHSFSDGASNIVGLISITLASKPIDEEHPYGHKKIETMASLIIGGMLLFLTYNIVMQSIQKFFNKTEITVSLESIMILLATLFINIFVAYYENKQGKKYNSSFLIADSIHTKSDIFVSIGVLTTLICIKLGLPSTIDVFVSIVVAGFILYAAYEIFKDAYNVLIDSKILDEEKIKDVVMKTFNNVKDVHKIRSRGGKDYIFVDMHIKVNPNLKVSEVHLLVHDIDKAIKKKDNRVVETIIHVEPFK